MVDGIGMSRVTTRVAAGLAAQSPHVSAAVTTEVPSAAKAASTTEQQNAPILMQPLWHWARKINASGTKGHAMRAKPPIPQARPAIGTWAQVSKGPFDHEPKSQ